MMGYINRSNASSYTNRKLYNRQSINNSAGSATGGISIGSSGSNQVGVMVKGNSNLAVTGGVAVQEIVILVYMEKAVK